MSKIKITWHIVHPEAVCRSVMFPPEAAGRIYHLDEAKSWKASLIRGHDIAELIAQELWETEVLSVGALRITAPEKYAGHYEVTTKFEPNFTAKQLDLPEVGPKKKRH